MDVLKVRVVGEQDPEEGGKIQAVWDAEDGTLQTGTKWKIKSISAAYTVTGEDSGTLILVKAALTLTLPAVSDALKGVWVRVINATDTDLVIAATANQMKTFNDLDADAVTINTSSEKVGYCADFICDGSFWYECRMADEAQTVTVTT